MGTLDDHDPAVSDAFAGDREVILFNNAGVASSSGTVPGTIEAMARDAITFIDALGLDTIDVAGHSMGGLVAQEVALARPDLVRRLVLAGTGPRGGEGTGALPAWVAELFTRKYQRQEDMWLPILFAPTQTSQAAGRAYVERILARADRDAPVSDQSIAAQRTTLAAYGAAQDPGYAHLKGLELPVLVVNGSDDIVIPTINSYILQQFLPPQRRANGQAHDDAEDNLREHQGRRHGQEARPRRPERAGRRRDLGRRPDRDQHHS
ncbi:MAG TPA: alpha/beta hydrolase [Streptosporangiaceae bacterium]